MFSVPKRISQHFVETTFSFYMPRKYNKTHFFKTSIKFTVLLSEACFKMLQISGKLWTKSTHKTVKYS